MNDGSSRTGNTRAGSASHCLSSDSVTVGASAEPDSLSVVAAVEKPAGVPELSSTFGGLKRSRSAPAASVASSPPSDVALRRSPRLSEVANS